MDPPMEGRRHFGSLPTDCYSLIIGFIDSLSAVRSCTVSKEWNACVREYLSIGLSFNNADVWRDWVMEGFWPKVDTLSLSLKKRVYIPPLDSTTIWGYEQPMIQEELNEFREGNSFFDYAVRSGNLTRLSISNMACNNTQMESISKFVNLKELKFSECRGDPIISTGFRAPGMIIGGETRIDLFHLTKLEKLERLDFYDCLIAEDSCQHLGQITSLTDLSLVKCSLGYLSEDWVSPLAELQNVTHLDISSNMLSANAIRLTHLGISSNIEQSGPVQWSKGISLMKQLTSLNVSDNGIRLDDAKNISTLENIKILKAENTRLNQATLEVISQMENLTDLNVSRNHIDDECAKIISSSKNLRCLDIGWNLMTSDGYRHLVDLEHLVSLRVNDAIVDSGCMHICRIKTLNELTLTSTEIDKDLPHITTMKNLTRLRMTLRAIDEEDALQLCGMDNLKYLNLGMVNIRSEEIESLSKMKSLLTLELHSQSEWQPKWNGGMRSFLRFVNDTWSAWERQDDDPHTGGSPYFSIVPSHFGGVIYDGKTIPFNRLWTLKK